MTYTCKYNVLVQSPNIPIVSSEDFTNLHPWYWNTLSSQSHLLWARSAFAHSAAAVANHYNVVFLLHKVFITTGYTETV